MDFDARTAIFGLDISKWQGAWHDPSAAVRSGVDFIYIRGGNGLTNDSKAASYADACKRSGLPFGLYWFFRPQHDPVEQAKRLHQRHIELGATLIPQLDIEESDGLSREAVTNAVATFIEEVERMFGRPALVYSAAWWWNPNILPGAINMANRVKWVARYVSMDQSPPVEVERWPGWAAAFNKEPRLPHGWDRWDAWQFSADGNHMGPKFGFESSHLDLNICRPDFLNRVRIGAAPTTAPVAAPTPSKRPYTGTTDGVGSRRAGTDAFANGLEQISGGQVWNNGTFGVRSMRGSSRLSVHATGRAIDLSRRAHGGHRGCDRATFAKLIDALVSLADEIGLEMIVDYEPAPHGRGWKCDRAAWKVYTEKTVTGGGASWADWIHIELDPSHADRTDWVPAVLAKLAGVFGGQAPAPVDVPVDVPVKLVRGARGAAVHELQTLLKAAGVDPGPIDGVFGAVTDRAVRRYQQSRGLTVDGWAGKQTMAALRSGRPDIDTNRPVVRDTLRRGSRGRSVATLQSLLAARGLYSSKIDGVFGPVTEQAVRRFQKQQRIVVDGIVGAQTWSKLT